MDLCRYDHPDKGQLYYKQCFVDHDDTKTFKEENYQGLCNQLLTCGGTPMSCKEIDGVTREGTLNSFYRSQLEDHFEEEEEHAFQRKASVIFNAFIFMQVSRFAPKKYACVC